MQPRDPGALPAAGEEPARRAQRLCAALVCAAFAWTLVRNAWLQDDAYITLRTIENLWAGRGPVWNPGERVHTNTHPLWMLVLALPYGVTREGYLTALATTGALSLLAVGWLVFRAARSAGAAAVLGLVVCLSRAFVDYSSAGLENPLSHVLLALALLPLLQPAASDARQVRASIWLAAGLLALNRHDLVLLIAPPLLAAAARASRDRHLLAGLALCALPLLLWECFAVVYYGSLVPNVANAKLLDLGIPRGELARQGCAYVARVVRDDPLTPLAIAVGCAAGLLRRERVARAAVVGIAAYLGYVVWIGGCFMAGRFFTAPLYAALLLLATAPARGLFGARALLPLFALVGLVPALLSGRAPPPLTPRGDSHPVIPDDGIVDCRRYYFQLSGLCALARPSLARLGREAPESESFPALSVGKSIGYPGFHCGPRVHFVDELGLCDPLLARLPAAAPESWRIGHVRRALPAGYLATLGSGELRLRDADLARYYEQLDLVLRAPLFAPRRLRAIEGFLSGRWTPWLASYVEHGYRREWPLRVALADVQKPLLEGAPWHAAGALVLDGPLHVALPEPSRAARIQLALERDDDYALRFLRDGTELGRAEVAARDAPGFSALHTALVAVPEAAVAAGYDALELTGSGGDAIYAAGDFRLLR